MTMLIAALALTAVAIWVYLIAAHGRFWLSRPELAPVACVRGPRVDIVVPARDEAQSIGPVIASLLAQDYGAGESGAPGAGAPRSFVVTLVDDNSTDGTAERAG